MTDGCTRLLGALENPTTLRKRSAMIVLMRGTRAIEVNRPYLNFSKNMLDRWHLHTGSIFVARFNALTLQRITQLQGFVLF